MTDETNPGPVPSNAGDAGALEPGEVPAGYSDRGGTDRCDECIFFIPRVDGPDGSAPGECTVHGLPPYIVDAGGWCPAWEAMDDDDVPPFPSFDILGGKTC
jgi:hypothetical protein